MQNVACAITIVQVLNPISRRAIDDRRAMPVTMPGSAIGRITRNETASLPKNFVRYTAAASRLPNTRAIPVAAEATTTDRRRARQIAGFLNATSNQSSVNPGGGNRKLEDWEVNANSRMMSSGA